MKTIGFVDYYISEWHANNYPVWIKEICNASGEEFAVKYVWAEKDVSPVDGVTTAEWCAKYGAEQCGTIEELCRKADYILILAPSDPEKHLGYAERVLKHGKRTYIDKTFAPDFGTAEKIFALGEKYGALFFSSSALRYASELEGRSGIKSVITVGGGGNMPEYLIHQIEMAVKLLGCGARRLKTERAGDDQYIIRVEYNDERKAAFVFSPGSPFAVMTQDERGEAGYISVSSDYFKALLADILHFYATGEKSFDGGQTLEVMKIREKAVAGISAPGEWLDI